MHRPKAWAILVTAVLTTAAMALATQSATGAPVSTTFKPAADAYTSSDRPTTNFGTATALKADASPIATSYLRFDVQGLGGPVTKATLRLLANSGCVQQGSRPALCRDQYVGRDDPQLQQPACHRRLDRLPRGCFTPGQWASLDATPLVSGNGLVSMAVTTTSTTSRNFHAREAAQIRRNSSSKPLT